ncbi:MAG: hypothetical protein U0694_26625 [Anaerolineae bacterium]
MSELTTGIVQMVSRPSDLNRIARITKGIIGKMCWRVRLGYGDELKLDIGKRVPAKVVRDRGEWYLGSRGTDWTLQQDGKVVLTSDEEPEKINREIQVILHNPIVSLEAVYPSLGLAIKFANGYMLSINPKKEDDDFEVAYWELFTPYGMVLKVGWGTQWSYTSVHDPA